MRYETEKGETGGNDRSFLITPPELLPHLVLSDKSLDTREEDG
jgi:hypothetical protein